MKSTRPLWLAAAALVWIYCTGVAGAQAVGWSEQSYDALAPSNSSKTIAPGTHINAQNWQQYKDFMPVGMQQLWAGKSFWHLPGNAEMVVGATTPTPLPKQYRADTEKYSSQVKLVPDSHGGYNITGYVAGAPFPNPSGPQAGEE